ncbi:hypothetical protein EFO53_03560 [Lacticaseibacillus rhamnosus]|uniref:Alpha-galactosidase n=1 Tax=Lacticaseibacillus rhamnosus TaxID=47715 RepID=A0AB74I950_LACRH|nr:conserved hypothetical protein [Lacticaseibacillus rhamnosus ATCC 8530]AGP75590.1 Alpha-galactosidase [Lacticaseibacillus rhamnosus LOCK908]MCT3147021.1 hypothetical protein [Lacticaseibacillus rhamnosus]MCT3149751.1 hypothetical protein [Lacticaseibacillus rhamnosus]MCT3156117.1 hypothetical protein [Lacticaseibacillus rhamnosus]
MLSCVLCAHGCVCVTDKSDGRDERIKKTKKITWSLGSAGAQAITRSPAQKPAHKDLGRNGQSPAITTKATYAPVSKRAGSRLTKKGPAESKN